MKDADTKTIFVIDSSFVLSKLLLEEHKPLVLDIFNRYEKNKVYFLAPELLKIEVANGLRSATIRKRITASQSRKLISSFLCLNIKYVSVEYEKVLELALEENLSVYDACFLFLAKKNGIQLLSLDIKLMKLSEEQC